MIVKLSLHVTLTETDEGAVLLHERTGRYWQLNRTGLLVLTALRDGETPQQAASLLGIHHGAPPEQAQADVDALVTALCAAGLVVDSD